MIRDIVRKPESAPVLKQKFYQNIAIHEVYLEAVPTVLMLLTILIGGNYNYVQKHIRYLQGVSINFTD